MRQFRSILFALLLLSAFNLFAASKSLEYRSATVDEKTGQLHIVLASGQEVVPPREKNQVAFDQASISPDHKTVGWLELYPDPDAPEYKGSPLAEVLVLFENNRVLHRFKTDQIFWDWRFVDGGTKVAYSTGPTHGGAFECVLRDVKSGTALARWNVHSGSAAPRWARALRF